MKFRSKITTDLLALLILGQIILSPKDVSAAQSTARLSSIKGEVLIKTGGGLREFPAAEGTELVQGDWLRTGKTGTAKLTYEDGTEATIGTSTYLNIQRLTTSDVVSVSDRHQARINSWRDGHQTSIELWAGSVWSKVKSLMNIDDKYEVETPTAVMGVRGTLYLVSVDQENGATQSDVIDGAVGVTQNQEDTLAEPVQLVTMGRTLKLVSLTEPLTDNQVIDQQDLIKNTQAGILVHVINDVIERMKELGEKTKEQQQTFVQTGNIDDIKYAVGTSFKLDELASFGKEFINNLLGSAKLEEVKQLLQDNHQSIEQVQTSIDTIKTETEEIRSEVLKIAKDAGVSQAQIDAIGQEATGASPTPDSGPTVTPPTEPSGGGGGGGGGGGSSTTTLTSTDYTVSEGSITNVPYGTSKETFLSKLAKGESHQSWDTSGVHDPIVSNDTIVVKAQNGRSATYTITVAEALDTIAPIITLIGNASVEVANGVTYVDAGVTITDNKDTGLIATVTYTKDGTQVTAIDTSVAGTYVVHYNVKDAAGNQAAEVSRTVIVAEVLDTIAPIITLIGNASVEVANGVTYVDAGVTITDNKDTGLIATVTYTKDGTQVTAIDTLEAGTYVVHYNVKDAAGNQAAVVTRTVIVAALTPVSDIASYEYVTNEEPGGQNFVYTDISSSGDGEYYQTTDDTSKQIPIGFDFNFYGVNYNQVFAGSNGYLTFREGDSAFENYSFHDSESANIQGSELPRIAPFFDDLIASRTGSGIYYKTEGVAPNRKLIVQWRTQDHFTSSDETVDFEAILSEGTDNILFQYQETAFGNSEDDYGNSATVGINKGDGQSVRQFSYDFPSLSNGLTVLFSPGALKTPSAPEVSANDSDNVIVGLNQTMEFKVNNGMYVKYDGTNDPNLSGNHTVLVRVAAVQEESTTSDVSILSFTESSLNSAPTFTSAIITGTEKVGEELTAEGVGYADAESDEEGTPIYQWIISDTADGTYENIIDATSDTYTPVSGDEGKFIEVKVTPVAIEGTLIGTPVTSDATAAVEGATKAEGMTVTVVAKETPENGTVVLTVIPVAKDASHKVYYRIVEADPIGINVGYEITPTEWTEVLDTNSTEISAVDGEFIEAVEISTADSKVTKWGKSAAANDGYTTADVTVVAVNDVSVTTEVGTAPVLPEIVTATMSDATTREVAVIWDNVVVIQYAAAGSFYVRGSIDGSEVEVRATVTVIAVDVAVAVQNVDVVNGTLTVTLNSTPAVAPVIADFVVKLSIDSSTATAVTPTAISTIDSVVTLIVPPIAATTVDQSVEYSVSYKGGVFIAAPAFTVDKIVDPQIAIIAEATAAVVAYEVAPADNAEEITAAEVLEETAKTKVALITDANTKAALEARITTKKQAVGLAKTPN